MAWSKLEHGFRTHPKLDDLAERLEVDVVTARGLMAGLWSWCTTFAEDGDLRSFTPAQIARAADWSGDPGLFLTSLYAARLADERKSGPRVHNWMKRAGSYKKAQQKQAERKRSRSATVARQVGDTSRDGVATVALRGEERRGKERSREDTRGEARVAPVPLRSTPSGAKLSDVSLVFEAWRARHPDHHLTPHTGLKEWQAIEARFDEDITAAQLIEAIEGIHRDDWVDRPRNLTLMATVKSSEGVHRFRAMAENSDKPKLSAKEQRSKVAVQEFIEKRRDK